MKIYGVRVFVDDYARARAFYGETLGFPIEWEMAEHGVAGFKAGETLFIVGAAKPGEEHHDLIGRFVGATLAVDDIDATWRRLAAAGVPFDMTPEKQFWGGTLAHFRDPAGNVLTLLG